MALRVLLADNSETIKRVVELSLQDFAVELKVVTAGVDVADVARSFRPDIILADVLLQKKNGYEVSQELHQDADLSLIPVVLIWSGFMELDEEKVLQCGAKAKLEKPFDSEQLRKIIRDLVPKTSEQPLEGVIELPPIPKEEEAAKTPEALTPELPQDLPSLSPEPLTPAAPEPLTPAVPDLSPPTVEDSPIESETSILTAEPSSESPPPVEENQDSSNWNMESFEDVSQFAEQNSSEDLPDFELGEPEENFSQVSLADGDPLQPQTETPPIVEPSPEPEAKIETEPKSEGAISDDNWVQKDLDAFEIDLPDDTDFEEVTVNFKEPDETTENTAVLLNYLKETGTLDSDANLPGIPNTEASPQPENMTEPKESVEPMTTQPPQTDQKTASPPANADLGNLSVEQIEQIVKDQTAEIVEKVVQRLVPDMATEIIKNEIQRLLEENSVDD